MGIEEHKMLSVTEYNGGVSVWRLEAKEEEACCMIQNVIVYTMFQKHLHKGCSVGIEIALYSSQQQKIYCSHKGVGVCGTMNH